MNLLFLGHSLIEFFDWQARFPEHRVAGSGVAGESVEGLLARLEQVQATFPAADFIFLMTGLNNLAMEDYQFFGSYLKIIKKLQADYPTARICVHSILPVRIEFIDNASIRQANLALHALTVATGVAFLDLYGLFVDDQGEPLPNLFTGDGVHLSTEGYLAWTNFLTPLLADIPNP